MEPKKPVHPDLVDLGGGRGFFRAAEIAGRPGRAKRPRRIVVVDLQPPARKVPEGVEYVQRDATEYLESLEPGSVPIVNADSFFNDDARLKRGRTFVSPQELMDRPIDARLLSALKRVLPTNGRVFVTTVKWHADPLAKLLEKEGFKVSMRPLTEKEATEGPPNTRMMDEAWKKGEFYQTFGTEGWRQHRMVATLRKK